MLGAFLGWVATAPAEMQREVEHLYTIDHAMMTMGTQVLKPKLPTGVDLQSFQCNTANCRRCTSLQGGYQFKWYDARWVVAYNRMKRDGAVSLPMASSSPGGGSGLRNDLPLPQDLVTSTFRRPPSFRKRKRRSTMRTSTTSSRGPSLTSTRRVI